MTVIRILVPLVGALALTGGPASAQPLPVPIPLPPPTPPPDGTPPDGTPPDGTPPEGTPPDGTAPDGTGQPPTPQPPPPGNPEVIAALPTDEAPPSPPSPPLPLPELLLAPTGYLLPAGVIYSRSGVDTSGGLSGDLRFGLGQVAEFGVAMTDLIRAREAFGATPERLAPFYTATFRMGLAEDRLFAHQPALTLGFRKSFEHEDAGRRARIAELHLAASKRLGARASVHVNGTFWDASVEDVDGTVVALHDQGLGKQLRVGGGVAIRAVDDADIAIDLAWVPEFCFTCLAENRTRLRPVLSWGVRYDLARWAMLQSGVRVPDIGDANLLDAQIFGQLTLVNRTLERVIARKR
ncbi:MAG: hypothetical protein KBG48_31160 [Kofleriaceae bacterium]|nr:hypothetical protein [Kofleriaceae bacterium]MBP9171893.1 hypothetical protein [Kofleriaceae bacterium]MBP9858166.1 hypothetical protein [Kofleriaceae bacterium]